MTQTQSILKFLQDGNTITPLSALDGFGCFRLASRISELKKEGHRIVRTTVEDKRTGKHYASYALDKSSVVV